MKWPLALLWLGASATSAVHAQSGSPAFCDRLQALSASQQDILLRFAGVVRKELDEGGAGGAAAGGVGVAAAGGVGVAAAGGVGVAAAGGVGVAAAGGVGVAAAGGVGVAAAGGVGVAAGVGPADDIAGGIAGGILISRSGLDLSRFHIRYSHTGVAWKSETGAWSARQLYYACDEGRPRIFDQGVAGFAMGIDNPALGYIAIVRVPAAAAAALRAAALDTPRALHLLSDAYSATAYPFSLRYQNCNQWIAELMAAAWGNLADGDDLRGRAQAWLAAAPYSPAPVLPARWLFWAAPFVPFVHLDDHPAPARQARQLAISLPASLEAFVRQRWPDSERVELCHNSHQVVVHRGWTSVAEGCVAGEGDTVIALDDGGGA